MLIVIRPKIKLNILLRWRDPSPTCSISRKARQPSDLRRPDLKVGGHFHSPTCRPLASGESGFAYPVQGTRGRRWGCSEPPSPLPPLPKGGAGNPLTATPNTALLPRHLHVTLTSPRRCPPQRPVALHADPPLYPPATVSCHPGEPLSRHVTSVSGPRHDVMLTSSAEKRQMHIFAKFNNSND